MTDLSAEYKALAEYRPKHKVRFVTAASLFDGHDAAINIMRRILQGMGAEVIHLGHNRSVDEVVTAALQEDAQGIAISSYQGGHVEYFKYMVELLRQRGGAHIKVFGGGGGVIVPAEIQELQASGVTRIYSPEDGQRMGLAGMIGEMLMMSDSDLSAHAPKSLSEIRGPASRRALAQLITALENGKAAAGLKAELLAASQDAKTPVLGITGTGGAGKSSLMHLAGGLYAPWSGDIHVAGADPRAMTDEERRQRLGVVPQTLQLFSGSVLDNLTMGDVLVTRTACEAAAKATGAHAFIRALPQGYDTPLDAGEAGAALSAGQRQLLALTRALVRQPRVLLLDEATAAIDHASDAAFRAALRRDAHDSSRAVLIVAHRLSTALEADRIIVIEDGRILEQGAPDELIRCRGRFAALLAMETAGWDWHQR